MVYRKTPRSEQARAATRNSILAEAWSLFNTKGYDATTMQDIVKQAGTSIGNAYFYFENKEALLIELVDTHARSMWDNTEAAVGGMPFGPARFASTVFLNYATALRAGVPNLLFVTDPRFGSLNVAGRIVIGRWVSCIKENFPDATANERKLAAVAIWGMNRMILESVGDGTLDVQLKDLSRFAARWSLRGLGVPDNEIASALRIAARKSK